MAFGLNRRKTSACWNLFHAESQSKQNHALYGRRQCAILVGLFRRGLNSR